MLCCPFMPKICHHTLSRTLVHATPSNKILPTPLPHLSSPISQINFLHEKIKNCRTSLSRSFPIDASAHHFSNQMPLSWPGAKLLQQGATPRAQGVASPHPGATPLRLGGNVAVPEVHAESLSAPEVHAAYPPPSPPPPPLSTWSLHLPYLFLRCSWWPAHLVHRYGELFFPTNTQVTKPSLLRSSNYFSHPNFTYLFFSFVNKDVQEQMLTSMKT